MPEDESHRRPLRELIELLRQVARTGWLIEIDSTGKPRTYTTLTGEDGTPRRISPTEASPFVDSLTKQLKANRSQLIPLLMNGAECTECHSDVALPMDLIDALERGHGCVKSYCPFRGDCANSKPAKKGTGTSFKRRTP